MSSSRPTRRVLPLVLAALLCPAITEASDDGMECSDCHEVNPEVVASSVHGFLECTDCHAAAAEFPHEAAPVDCATCHEGVAGEYAASIHGRARSHGATEAPDCSSCHGEIHTLQPVASPDSPVNPARLPETCGGCHSDPEMVAKFHIPIARPLEAYRQSVHARAVGEGLHGATCSDCHGSHGIFDASDPRSKANHQRVPETCGACHEEIAAVFEESVHGVAAAQGVRDSPVCTDCHSEHRILSPSEPGSPVYATNIPVQTCGRCHGNVRLAEKYGIPEGKVEAYELSYHGMASRSGAVTVANCASCHGVHDIQPSWDERSHVHASNLAVTCGQCHPGAGKRFAIGPVHVDVTEARFPLVYWIRWIYLPLIWFTVGAMLLHNFLDLRRKQGLPHLRPPRVRPRQRMLPGFRIAHLAVMVSFILLVYTGFALKYPESWWARPLLFAEGSFGLRGWLHRAAAVVLLAACAFHVVHLVVDRRARACIARMRPSRHDLQEVVERLGFNLGRRREMPHAPAVGYIEKVEYLAFMWGMGVMAATGFVLWFENLALRWLPTWAIDAATAVHFYEAILATLAIGVWHGYWVIFDPVVYPMDWSWWNGVEPPGRVAEREAAPYADAATDPDEDARQRAV
ncbi:MAG: cytochrome c3 family protein [Acidobacteriota bacterium]